MFLPIARVGHYLMELGTPIIDGRSYRRWHIQTEEDERRTSSARRKPVPHAALGFFPVPSQYKKNDEPILPPPPFLHPSSVSFLSPPDLSSLGGAGSDEVEKDVRATTEPGDVLLGARAEAARGEGLPLRLLVRLVLLLLLLRDLRVLLGLHLLLLMDDDQWQQTQPMNGRSMTNNKQGRLIIIMERASSMMCPSVGDLQCVRVMHQSLLAGSCLNLKRPDQ